MDLINAPLQQPFRWMKMQKDWSDGLKMATMVRCIT